MTNMTLPRIAAAEPFPIGATPVRAFARLMGGVRRWVGRRRTCDALSSLNDHALKDIGLHRSMIASVSIHGAHSVEEARSRMLAL